MKNYLSREAHKHNYRHIKELALYQYPNRQQRYASLCHLLGPKSVSDIGILIYMSSLAFEGVNCENWVGGLGSCDKKQETSLESMMYG